MGAELTTQQPAQCYFSPEACVSRRSSERLLSPPNAVSSPTKIYCVYTAKDADIIREHARCGGFPADAVNEVVAIIDPVTGEQR